MENVIPIDQLPSFIDETLAKVNEGVWLARKRGLLAEMPKEVQIDVLVVKEWQALEIVGAESSVGTETSKGNDSSESSEESNGSETNYSKDNGQSTRIGKSESNSIDNSTGSRNSAENSLQSNYTNEQ